MYPEANPFTGDITKLDLPAGEQGATTLYRTELKEVVAAIQKAHGGAKGQPRGKVILLAAPRAGCGKTLFLQALREKISPQVPSVSLDLIPEAPPGWGSFYQALLNGLLSTKTTGAPSLLDALARNLLASACHRLIHRREIRGHVGENILSDLTQHPLKALDFDHPQRSPATRWFREHYRDLHPHIITTLAEMTGISQDEIASWIDLLYRFTDPQGHLFELRHDTFQRLKKIGHHQPRADSQMPAHAPQQAGGEEQARKQCTSLCRLASTTTPLLLILDGLDGFYRKPASGTRLARILTNIQDTCPGTTSILSVNDDLWHSSFAAYLPSATEDRLTTKTVRLDGIDLDGARRLLLARLRDSNIPAQQQQRFLHFLPLNALFLSKATRPPREILRAAAKDWEHFCQGEDQTDSLSEGFLAPETTSPDTTKPHIFEDDARGLLTNTLGQLGDDPLHPGSHRRPQNQPLPSAFIMDDLEAPQPPSPETQQGGQPHPQPTPPVHLGESLLASFSELKAILARLQEDAAPAYPSPPPI